MLLNRSSNTNVVSLFYLAICSKVSPHHVNSPSLDNKAVTFSNEAPEVGLEAPTNEEAEGLDVNIQTPDKEGNGSNEIPETPNDFVSLLKLDSD